MDLVKPQDIEENIIRMLGTTACSAEVLLLEAQKSKPSFTKQALYQTLRKLIDREIVVKHGKQFSLSQPWILRMSDFFSFALHQYGASDQGTDFLSLPEGDKVSYSFKNPTDADRFWGHAFSVLGKMVGTSEPVYLYNPHDWFLLARNESEVFLFEEFRKASMHIWILAGNKYPLDIYVKKYFDGNFLQYHTLDKALFEAQNYYLNIFGEYIIEVRLDEKTTDAIENFYQSTTIFDTSAEERIKAIVSSGKTHITISRNTKKVEKLKRLFKEYFYIQHIN